MTYLVGAREYLGRARARVADEIPESVFYAAFELRCGIEARLQEHLAAWDHVGEKEKRQWQVKNLSKAAQKAFSGNESIVQIDVRNRSIRETSLFFTPVSRELVQIAGELGRLLHAQYSTKDMDGDWWNTARAVVSDGLAWLKVATSGTLLGPPLSAESRTFNMNTEIIPYRVLNLTEFGVGTEFEMDVAIHDNVKDFVFPPNSYVWVS